MMKLLEETCDRSKGICERIIAYVYSIVGSRKCVVVNGEEFLIGRRIAEGAFSYVYVTQSKRTGKHFALKRIITQTKEQRQGVNWEIQVHETFNHPNLLKLYGFVTERQNGGADVTSLLFPLCSRGSLESALQRKRPQKSGVFFTESESIRYLNQVCEGLKLFHNHSPAWAHMDIKPGNVLLDSRGKPVLMDFGSTSIARKTPKSRSEALHIQEWAAENCSMPYRAPELFEVKSQVKLTESVDIWYALAFGYSPFECAFSEETGEVRVEKCSFLRVINGVVFPPNKISKEFSSSFQKLIKDMTHKTASKRPSVHELLSRTENWNSKTEEKSVV